MKHTILTVLLTLGVVFGIAHGVFHTCHGHSHRRAQFESHVADVCVAAVKRELEKSH
jgi:hypothetical protein